MKIRLFFTLMVMVLFCLAESSCSFVIDALLNKLNSNPLVGTWLITSDSGYDPDSIGFVFNSDGSGSWKVLGEKNREIGYKLTSPSTGLIGYNDYYESQLYTGRQLKPTVPLDIQFKGSDKVDIYAHWGFMAGTNTHYYCIRVSSLPDAPVRNNSWNDDSAQSSVSSSSSATPMNSAAFNTGNN